MTFIRKSTDDDDIDHDIDNHSGTPIKYVSLDRVYSAASLCVSATGSSNVMSKKVKARKLIVNDFGDTDDLKSPPPPPPPPVTTPPPPPVTAVQTLLPPPLERNYKPKVLHVYSRCHKRARLSFFESALARNKVESEPPVNVNEVVVKTEFFESDEGEGNEVVVKTEFFESDEGEGNEVVVKEGKNSALEKKKERRRLGNNELMKLGVDSSILCSIDRPRLRDGRNYSRTNGTPQTREVHSAQNRKKGFSASAAAKKWVRLRFEGVDPEKFIGLLCKVFWPLDADWYSGRVLGYNLKINRHQVEYEDGDKEDLNLPSEKIRFYISREEMEHLNLEISVNIKDTTDGQNYNEMVVLAASLDDSQEFESGDIIWAKLTGHAMWPAIIVDESSIGERKGLSKTPGGRSVPVQFFGTHDFARIKVKQIISFLNGLLSSFHQKCKQPSFTRSLEEARMYLSEQKLPERMLQLRNDTNADDSNGNEGNTDSGEDCITGEGGLGISPYVIGDLKIISLGKIVKDSKYFQDNKFIWPEGYTAKRKFTSFKDPNICSLYKMEVLRDSESKIRPLFRVTADNGQQFQGSTPAACWDKIYEKIRETHNNAADDLGAEKGRIYKPGSDMFGFSNPKVTKLIQAIPKFRLPSNLSMLKYTSGKYQDLPIGYRPVRVDWKDLDKCNVCHMDEEYANNLFLQCDKCRMMVHARCYGELETVDDVLWLCNLCRPGALKTPPPCCLCPVLGGAMKPTTDGRWAHLACAIWIPETCLSDVKMMEPIDGINRISKDRWKLLCSICGVSYGACIQCSNHTCRVAYHPLCARAAGLCVELEDEERLHLLSLDDEEEEQCIRLLSFCKKHRQSNERSLLDEQIERVVPQCSDYNPPSNPSGCARTEPYDFFGRRGRKEPEDLGAASLKRLFVENQPYVVSGYSQHELVGSNQSNSGVNCSSTSFSLHELQYSRLDAPNNIVSMAEKYKYMRETFRKRLTFGKSGIHGFGIFTKHPHRAGDMVIEYSGELVRPSIADRRERLIYNSLVGAGTYMFRIDDERVIDATRAGSIAHLINHSCEPNCYSRVISVNGDDHIIIFAKRDIKRWEELTYDYRFFSIDEQLACYCGFPRCRGIVNDIEAEEQLAKLHAPRSELKDFREE